MTERKGSQKGFVAVTLITILAIALVLIVYATFLGTFTGGEVVYGENLDGQVLYSKGNLTDTGNWTNSFAVASGSAWYACLNITSTDGYIGEVTVTFRLQFYQNSTNVGLATVATITLNGTVGERVYVSPTGVITNNRNWQSSCTAGYSYKVQAQVDST